ncbi:MAG: hypothetical protein R3D25_05895 [Geminicoccaceae bacterium]
MRSRLAFNLFWKIYLTLVACLAMVALAMGSSAPRRRRRDFEGWPDRSARFFAAMLPPGSGDAEVEGAGVSAPSCTALAMARSWRALRTSAPAGSRG